MRLARTSLQSYWEDFEVPPRVCVAEPPEQLAVARRGWELFDYVATTCLASQLGAARDCESGRNLLSLSRSDVKAGKHLVNDTAGHTVMGQVSNIKQMYNVQLGVTSPTTYVQQVLREVAGLVRRSAKVFDATAVNAPTAGVLAAVQIQALFVNTASRASHVMRSCARSPP